MAPALEEREMADPRPPGLPLRSTAPGCRQGALFGADGIDREIKATGTSGSNDSKCGSDIGVLAGAVAAIRPATGS